MPHYFSLTVAGLILMTLATVSAFRVGRNLVLDLRPVLQAALFVALCWQAAFVSAKEPELLELSGDLAVHDPVMAKENGTYYLFATGGFRGQGIVSKFTSPDMREWSRAGTALDKLPGWVAAEIPKARNAWAPDISYFDGKYHLYYSLSSFGVNHSAIALATNRTLDPDSPDYQWQDQGLVVSSRPGDDDFNAIDPNAIVESDDRVWLAWGSFWGGVMMRQLDPKTGKLSAANTSLYKLAARPRQGKHKTPPVEGAIEAPFIIRHGQHWYLFVSWDFCCRGARSDYKVVVGRAEEVTGPYRDRDGKSMSDGGGTLILEAATDKWRGAGHPAVYREDGVDFLLFHAYSATNGRSRLQISTIEWDGGWPSVARLP
jgi:arabinan endo-1,5-alpha-L-arabinosidase